MTVEVFGSKRKNVSSFVKAVAIITVSTVSILGLGACGKAPEREADSVSVIDDKASGPSIDYEGGSGTSTIQAGKPGTELGGGITLPIGGSGSRVGFGF